jgi:hypothetical protein
MLLKAVAARNPWSIYVDTPHSLVLSASEQKASDKVSAEKLTEQYVYKVLDVTREKLKGSVHDDQGQTDVPLGGQDTAGGQREGRLMSSFFSVVQCMLLRSYRSVRRKYCAGTH